MGIATTNRRLMRSVPPQSNRWRRLFICQALGIVLLSLSPLAASAMTPLSQGYVTATDIPQGSIVSLQDNSSDQVVAATTKISDSILGVVINNDNALLQISNSHGNQVQVATSGIVSVLVSDINGDIHQGDQITASPIAGVGMKATSNTKVVGIAQGEPQNDNQAKQTYTDASGAKRQLTLGQVPVAVNAAYYFKQPDKTIIPAAVQKVANALAGKPVDALPIIISAAIFIITLVVSMIIIYSMIRSSIISVGRNPMSQSAIYRDVIQVSALVLGMMAVAVVAIYLILTRL